MSKRLSEETKQLIKNLYNKGLGLSVREIVKKFNISYTTAYGYTRVKDRGFASRTDYRKYLFKENQQKLVNQKLSDLIKRRLEKLNKNQSWLAKQMDVSREAVSKYALGKYTPRGKALNRLYSILEVPYKTLDDLLEPKNI